MGLKRLIFLLEAQKMRLEQNQLMRRIAKLKLDTVANKNLEEGKAIVYVNHKDLEKFKKEIESGNAVLKEISDKKGEMSFDEFLFKFSEADVAVNVVESMAKLYGLVEYFKKEGFWKTISHQWEKFDLKKGDEAKSKVKMADSLAEATETMSALYERCLKAEAQHVKKPNHLSAGPKDGGGVEDAKPNGNGVNDIHHGGNPFSDG